MRNFFLVTLAVLLLLPQFGFSQDVEDYLEEILTNQNKEYIEGSMQPVATALGSSMGSALFHRAYTKGFPRFDVGISTAIIMLPDEAKTFTHSSLGEVPTFFGGASNNGVDGVETDYFMLPMLHANVGLFANLELTGRFISYNIDNFGEISLYGGGLKYGLSELIPIPMFPIDFSLQAAYHKFTLGEILDAGTFGMNLQASYDIPVLPIDIYGGIGFDNSTMKIDTDALDDPNITKVGEVSIDGENAVKFNVGVSLTLLFFNIHADYNIGKYNSLAGGVMFVL